MKKKTKEDDYVTKGSIVSALRFFTRTAFFGLAIMINQKAFVYGAIPSSDHDFMLLLFVFIAADYFASWGVKNGF
jgi:hypothetical protein